MRTMDDRELLKTYAKDHSESAFAELARRHVNWVYSAARRQVNDAQLAEDITQSVFVLLARKAGSLSSSVMLGGWLFRTTRFVASRALRTEIRRKRREQTAVAMNLSTDVPDENEACWNQLAPHLEQAVAALPDTDRSAVLLRFYEKKPLADVGRHLGVSEDAAKKRVSRALEKMR
jgi:RNA polymerase sigma factor (sigma-70 family)